MEIDYQGLATLITSLTAAVVAIVTLIRTGRVEARQGVMSTKQDTMEKKQEVIHTLVNSQSEKLNVAVATIARAEGRASGIAEEREKPMVPATPVVVNVPELPSPLPVTVVEPDGTPSKLKN